MVTETALSFASASLMFRREINHSQQQQPEPTKAQFTSSGPAAVRSQCYFITLYIQQQQQQQYLSNQF
jgi:hypothetical protein